MCDDIMAAPDGKAQSAPRPASRRRAARRWWMAGGFSILAALALLYSSRSTSLGGDSRFVGTWQISGFGPPGKLAVAKFHADGSVAIGSVVEGRPRFRQTMHWTWRVKDGVLVLRFEVPPFSNPLMQLWFKLKMRIRKVDLSQTIPLQVRQIDHSVIRLENITGKATQRSVILDRISPEEANRLLDAQVNAPGPLPDTDDGSGDNR